MGDAKRVFQILSHRLLAGAPETLKIKGFRFFFVLTGDGKAAGFLGVTQFLIPAATVPGAGPGRFHYMVGDTVQLSATLYSNKVKNLNGIYHRTFRYSM